MEVHGPGATPTNFHYTDYYPALQRIPNEKGEHQVSRQESLGLVGVHFGAEIPDVFDRRLVGRRIKIYLPNYDQKWWLARINRFNPRTKWYKVIYDCADRRDDDCEWIHLWNEQVEWLDSDGQEAVEWETQWDDRDGPACGMEVETRFDNNIYEGAVVARVLATIRTGARAGLTHEDYRYKVRYHADGEEELLAAEELCPLRSEVQQHKPRRKKRRKTE